MPAKSERQQHFFQMIRGVQSGKLKASDLPPGIRSKVKDTAKTISPKAAHEFAAKVEEDENIDFSVLSFKEYIFVEAFSELSEDEINELLEKCSMEDEEKNDKSKGPYPNRGYKPNKKGVEDEEPATSKKIMKKAAPRGGKQARLSEKWDTDYKTPESKKGMFKGETQAELESELESLRKSGPHDKGSAAYTREKEVVFALRSKHGWKGV